MKRSVCDLVSLSGALFLVACSASAPPGGARGPGSAPGTRVPGTGGSAAPVGPGGSPIDNNFGNPGGLLGSGGSSATPGGAPGPGVMNASVDPNAPMYVADDTAMGGLDPATLTALKTGGAQCTVKVTFPYDNTVFPGGLVPPPIMFDGAADAAYVQFAYQGSDKVDYKFAAKVTAPAQVQIPRPAWDAITRRTNNLPLIVTLNTSSGGVVSSCKLRWKVAAGNMVGAIYYNTYQAPAPGVPGVGAVMRQSLGSEAEIYKQYTGALNPIPGTGPCYSCHSVSFNGSTMVSSFHDYSTQVFRVEKFDVTAAVQPTATGMLDNANFGALTPDGKKILAMGNPQCTAGSDSFPRKPNNFPLVEGAAVARLLDTATGMDLHATGLSKDFYMWMPQFSPDGTKIVFNHAKADASGGSDRFELATMDFNATTNTFSNLKVIVNATKLPGFVAPSIAYSPTPAFAGTLTCGADMCGADGVAGSCMSMMDTPAIPGIPGDVGALPSGSCAGPCYPGWPFFTPDNKAVVFGMTSEPDFTFAFPGRDKPALGELWYVDLETLEVVRLDAANKGLKDVDLRSNYYPTVMPVAVGGYFWVFWTAVRDYGQKVMGLDPSGAPMVAAAEAIKKRIWGAAIKPKTPTVENADLTLVDPSFPGFYVEGQSESGNVRAFAALNPCAANGATCTSGLDCCCGYCTQTDPTIAGACTCEIPMCAKLNEKCTKDSDCCPPATKSDPQLSCLGGFCGFLMLN